jgi:hypothetical protein
MVSLNHKIELLRINGDPPQRNLQATGHAAITMVFSCVTGREEGKQLPFSYGRKANCYGSVTKNDDYRPLAKHRHFSRIADKLPRSATYLRSAR